jgi:hypothetical protein
MYVGIEKKNNSSYHHLQSGQMDDKKAERTHNFIILFEDAMLVENLSSIHRSCINELLTCKNAEIISFHGI